MMRSFASVCFLLLFTEIALSQTTSSPVPLSSYVDPFIGSEGAGHIFVGPSAPFGMVKPGPDCNLGSNSGYEPDLKVPVFGFSQTHVSGTGGGPKYGNISLMPFPGEFTAIDQRSLRSKEEASAGFYGVTLYDGAITVSLTATERVAFHRYVTSGAKKWGVKIDCGSFLGEKPVPDSREAQQFVGSEVKIVTPTEVQGYSRIRGGWNNGRAYTVYFTALFDRPAVSSGTWKGKRIQPGADVQFDSNEKTGAFLLFEGTDTVQVKVGISFLSAEKAKANIAADVPQWNFDATLASTRAKWDAMLKTIELEATKDQKVMFYTALYHTMLMPTDRTGENPLWDTGVPYYDDFYALWDTFRSSHPLLTLIAPDRQRDIVRSLIDIYKNDGYFPDARSGNSNGRTQGGSNAEVVIADAYVKGLKGIDYGLALRGMLKDAQFPPGGNEEAEGRGGLTDYNTLGYVSTSYVRSGNRTVEYAYDDFCLAQVAKGLGRMGEYQRAIAQSDNWKNLWRDVEDNGARGFIMPKDAAGRWVDSIQCDVDCGKYNFVRYTPLTVEWPICVCWWCGFFYEGTSWEYSLSVPHDVPGLIERSGGKEAFRKRLDTFFDKGFYNVGNEPSFLTSCLYHWIGRPDLSSTRTRSIIDKNFNSSRAGIPGNDDSGAMSSWLAFHMMGFYPNAGQPYYLITAPYFKRTVMRLAEGKTFIITAKNLSDKNIHIKSAAFNGKPFTTAWIDHATIAQGGELVLEMTSAPTDWGKETPPPVIR